MRVYLFDIILLSEVIRCRTSPEEHSIFCNPYMARPTPVTNTYWDELSATSSMHSAPAKAFHWMERHRFERNVLNISHFDLGQSASHWFVPVSPITLSVIAVPLWSHSSYLYTYEDAVIRIILSMSSYTSQIVIIGWWFISYGGRKYSPTYKSVQSVADALARQLTLTLFYFRCKQMIYEWRHQTGESYWIWVESCTLSKPDNADRSSRTFLDSLRILRRPYNAFPILCELAKRSNYLLIKQAA
jgi:hypothetical protein